MKKIFRVLCIIIGIVLVACAGIASYIKIALPNVGKAPVIKVAITPQRLLRGAYLANRVANCMECHSKRDFTKYAGPIQPGTFGAGGEKFGKEVGFPGTIYSKNITPYALGSWTDGEIYMALTCGLSRNGKALFPLMPYDAFGKMSQEDLYSIIAYLRTLPPVKNEVPDHELDFPVNVFVNTVPKKPATTLPPDTTEPIAYGRYVINMSGCIVCHTKENHGDHIAGTEYGGGRKFGFENGNAVYSRNITFDKLTGIGNWTKSDFINRFKQYSGTAYTHASLAPGDNNTIMPWIDYSGMTDKDLGAIYDYLKTVTPIQNKVVTFVKKS